MGRAGKATLLGADGGEGFSGADPYEIALRYAAGQLSRERLVDELSRWDYAPDRRPPHPLDDGVILGDWKEYLVPALDHGLIDDATYEAIRAARSGASGDGGAAPERQTDMSTKEDHA